MEDNINDDDRANGYLYFIYSNKLKTIYVGESENEYRMSIYRNIIEEQNNFNRVRLYNYYTKHKQINIELAEDLVNKDNDFKIFYIKTQWHKILEKSYIKYLKKEGYNLYNRKLYAKWQIYDSDIDKDIISIFEK